MGYRRRRLVSVEELQHVITEWGKLSQRFIERAVSEWRRGWSASSSNKDTLSIFCELNIKDCSALSQFNFRLLHGCFHIGPLSDLRSITIPSGDNLFIIRSNLPIRQRISYFILNNSLLEYAESN